MLIECWSSFFRAEPVTLIRRPIFDLVEVNIKFSPRHLDCKIYSQNSIRNWFDIDWKSNDVFLFKKNSFTKEGNHGKWITFDQLNLSIWGQIEAYSTIKITMLF